jgi:hypothetical protein
MAAGRLASPSCGTDQARHSPGQVFRPAAMDRDRCPPRRLDHRSCRSDGACRNKSGSKTRCIGRGARRAAGALPGARPGAPDGGRAPGKPIRRNRSSATCCRTGSRAQARTRGRRRPGTVSMITSTPARRTAREAPAWLAPVSRHGAAAAPSPAANRASSGCRACRPSSCPWRWRSSAWRCRDG